MFYSKIGVSPGILTQGKYHPFHAGGRWPHSKIANQRFQPVPGALGDNLYGIPAGQIAHISSQAEPGCLLADEGAEENALYPAIDHGSD